MTTNDRDSTLIHDGSSVKALDEPGRVGGYLVLWGSPEATDSVRDYFEPDTDFGRAIKAGADVLFHHALPRVGTQPNPLTDRILGDAELKADDTGLWMESVLKLRDDYERKVYEMVKAGKLGLSSGTASHLMRRVKQSNGSKKVTRWPIVEASLTPTPAEPRTSVYALKSLMGFGDIEEIISIDENEGEGTAAAPSLADDLKRLAADARRLCALTTKAADMRRSEGRDLSSDKRDAIKAVLDEHRGLLAEIERLASSGAAPEPTPEAFDPDGFKAILSRARKTLRASQR
jgi:phage head maturation protease